MDLKSMSPFSSRMIFGMVLSLCLLGACANSATVNTGEPVVAQDTRKASTVNASQLPTREWNEEKVSKSSGKLTASEIVGVQLLLRAAGDGGPEANTCRFSDEWLSVGSQFFLGEWQTRFQKKKGPLEKQKICGRTLEKLSAAEISACAKKMASLCEKL
jgi:hypothetical protein